ncbi:MAG: hypothetical protein ACO1HP_01845 [Bacteroidota bacterium]
MKVRFKESCAVSPLEVYPKGSVHDLERETAQRHIDSGAAEKYQDEEEAAHTAIADLSEVKKAVKKRS